MAAKKTRSVGPLSFRASVVPASFNEEKRTIELVWSTGARVLRGSWDPYYEELSMKPKHVRMDRLKSGSAPLLNSHRSSNIDDVIGVVEKASLKGGEGHATVRFAKDEAGEAAMRKAADGILSNISVGYRTLKLQMTEESVDEVPVYRAIDWEPHELSLVPIGADAGATVRNEADLNLCELIGLDATEEQRHMKDQPAATPVAPQPVAAAPVESAPVTPNADQVRAIEVAALQRAKEIHRCAATLNFDPKKAERCIDEGMSADEFRKLAFDDFEARSTIKVPDEGAHASVTAGDDASDKFARGVSNWLITRASAGPRLMEAAKLRGEKLDLDPGEFRGMTLLDICRESLKANGQKYRGLSKVELAGAALSHRSAGGGYAGTSDFPVILENTLHKLLLAGWGTTPDTWSKFCHTGSVSDFRAHNRYRMGTFGVLETVAENGEFKNKSIPDARKESITASTKGNIIMLSRQAIINDDMDAFSRLAAMLGRAARLSVESDVYATLALNGGLGPDMADALPMFDAGHSNLGTTAALSVASIDADRVVLKSQTDESGNEILDLVPYLLLVGAGQGGAARQLNESQYDIDTDGGLASNSVRGLFSEIVDTARITGTRSYTFADPRIAPCLEVAFLDGQQEPYLEMQNGWRVDGAEWKVRLDYAVGGIDYRGAVTNAGA